MSHGHHNTARIALVKGQVNTTKHPADPKNLTSFKVSTAVTGITYPPNTDSLMALITNVKQH